MSRFFIDRPVFAWVIGLIIMLIGIVAIPNMPVAQYPSIAAPEVAISVDYPGASAETVNNTTVRPILQQMYGLDHLEYISATSFGSGHMEIDLTFEQGTNPDIAQVQVQNKLQLAQPRLPTEVVTQGISVNKSAKSFFLIPAFISEDGSMSGQDIADYIASNVSDPVSRVTGVGDKTLLGSEYAMRIWMDPNKLFRYQLNVTDVQNAIAQQNIQISSGELGGVPASSEAGFDASIIGPERFSDPEQFRNIVLKVQLDGSQVLLKDVARVELGAQNYNISSFYNNRPAVGIGLKLAPGSNQIKTEAAVRDKISELEKFFPKGLKTVYAFDTLPFITLSIHEVLETLVIAIILVFVVMLIFLQNFRATLIPTIAVPVVLLGTFGVLSGLGYSINTLTMLAMVLAVGLLVDDAIVVVENVERVMDEEGLSPKEASKASMDEIQGALVGIVLVLTAVFLPMAAFGGSTGVIYRQFSFTIVAAMWLSVLVALIMTPALCATMLRPSHTVKNRFAKWFNLHFDRMTEAYLRGVKWMINSVTVALIGFVILTGCVVFLFLRVPTGFLPEEDQGVLFGQLTMRPGATKAQTGEVNRRISDYIMKNYGDIVQSVFSVDGFNFAGQGQSAGAFFVRFKPWNIRTKSNQSAMNVAQEITMHFWGDPAAQIFAINPPPVMEMGNASGFDVELVDNGHLGRNALEAARDQLIAEGNKSPLLEAVRSMEMADQPQFHLDVDRDRANAQGITNSEINSALSGAFGSIYVNQFLRAGRVKQVYIQGEPWARMTPEDVNKWYIRNSSNTMVPFNSFAQGRWIYGPQKVSNYNGVDALEVQGSPRRGVSSGAAMNEIARIAKSLPAGIGYEWTNLSYEEAKSGDSTGPLYALAGIVILLCLAALYESWAIPLSVVLVLPLGVLGAIVLTLMRNLSNDVYFQVGLLTTVGLSVKNAILIVEFAKAFFEEGDSLEEAVIKAGRERLRPILMTSIAFVFGVLPLAFASGAGASSRQAIGTCVVGGMLSATALTIFFVPVFFVIILRLFRVKRLKEKIDIYAKKSQRSKGVKS
ncbi:efflux RND transporter permease subunit [Candidatus Kirkpatrickella diaphorinae]|uniref:Efflux pump membrane transporter n=1 Tax=Candidatus Kirkpatrickella diaphorinae TaxID=2984322 RepID=A0ABY6GM38_9PROT|nr:efflux RND transporter permease subunit [Candidatus Kirkpatrickella diaphorinae]UYH51938.1 efflux RND transporter permease subunit [Candidatus Kirkpatrickella diaphorinae]